jgi:hypothetical protein
MMNESGPVPTEPIAPSEPPPSNATPPAEAASSPEQTDNQARLTARLILIAVSIALFALATLFISALLGRFQSFEWAIFVWTVERSAQIQVGAAVIISLVTLSAMVFTTLYKNSSRLNWIFWILVAAILLTFCLLYLSSTDPFIQHIYPQIDDARFDIAKWPELPQIEAEARRAKEIDGAISTLLFSLLGWFGTSLATMLGIQSKIGDAVRRVRNSAS